MKVIGINGSARKDGNTSLLIKAVFAELEAEGIETELVQLHGKALEPCKACFGCGEKRQCVVKTDFFNECFAQMVEADGIVLGSPVYYANIAGTMKCFCDRLFYVASANGSLFRGKVGAGVVAARRGGASATFAELNYFLHLGQMIMPGSSYWNSVHGAKPLEAEGNAEGLQTMRNLARNIAWLLRLKASGEPMPQFETSARTNFIR